jgi:FkbM family methyltransferase
MRRVKVVHGGLGAENGFSNYAATLDDRPGSIGTQTGTIQLYDHLKAVKQRRVFPVYKIDTLVGDNRLAFAHIDVEGGEIEALQGADKTIMRDRPVITLETFPKSNTTKHRLLLEHMERLEYECTLLDEVCGWGDCRNLICTT